MSYYDDELDGLEELIPMRHVDSINGLTIKHKWDIEDFLICTEGPDVFDPYAEEVSWDDFGYEPWKD
jgi:hypothetical protein